MATRLPMPKHANDTALMIPRGAVLVLVRLLKLNGADVTAAATTARQWAVSGDDHRYALLAGILDEAAR